MDQLAGSLISQIYGAEEFLYLLGACFFNYGSLIGNGMYQHHTEEPEADGTSVPDTDIDLDATDTADTTADTDPQTRSGSRVANTQSQWIQVDLNKKPSTQTTSRRKPEPLTHAPSQSLIPERPDKKTNAGLAGMTNRIRANISGGGWAGGGGGGTGSAAAAGASSPSQEKQQQEENELQLRETVRGLKVDLDEENGVLDFGEVAGLGHVKTALEEFATFFMHFPHLTRNLRQRSTTGILLFGPQGTGKTLLVKSFARKYNLALFDVRASAIMSKFVGEAEKFIRALFREIRSQAPAVLMLDECDGLLCNPSSDAMQSHSYRLLQNELKNQWSDLIYSRDEVVIIGATNKPHDIDMDGFGRRLSLKLHIDLPNEQGCRMILQGALQRLRHALEEEDLTVLGMLCHEKNLSGYDIDCLVESQLRKAIRNITIASYFQDMEWEGKTIVVPCDETATGSRPGPWNKVSSDPEDVSYRPFTFGEMEAAVRRAKPTVDDAMRQRHKHFASQYGTEED